MSESPGRLNPPAFTPPPAQAAERPAQPLPPAAAFAAPELQVTPEQAAAVAREQLAAQQSSVTADAGPTIEQMQADQRQVLLPMETKINDMMAAQAAQAAQIAELQSQLAAAKQQAGPPAVEQYANGVATLVRAHADANPDLGPEVFKPALETASKLKDAATAAVTSRDTTDLVSLGSKIEKWATSFKDKHLDFSGLMADLELLGEAAERLAA